MNECDPLLPGRHEIEGGSEGGLPLAGHTQQAGRQMDIHTDRQADTLFSVWARCRGYPKLAAGAVTELCLQHDDGNLELFIVREDRGVCRFH